MSDEKLDQLISQTSRITTYVNQKTRHKTNPGILMNFIIIVSVLLFIACVVGGVLVFVFGDQKSVSRFFSDLSAVPTVFTTLVVIVALCYRWRYVFINIRSSMKKRCVCCYFFCCWCYKCCDENELHLDMNRLSKYPKGVLIDAVATFFSEELFGDDLADWQNTFFDLVQKSVVVDDEMELIQSQNQVLVQQVEELQRELAKVRNPVDI